MIILYILGGVVGTLLLVILIMAFTSPRVTRMQRSIEISAPPEKVFPLLNSAKRFSEEWSPWTGKDPAAKHTFSGPAEGVGATHAWTGDPKTVGSGSMVITVSETNRRVSSHLSFAGRGEADAGWTIEDLGGGKVRVTWDFASDAGNNPVRRLFGRMIEKFLGPDYEQGLAKLKSICEKI